MIVRHPCILSCVLAVLSALVVARVRAADLVFSGPEQCGSQTELAQRVARVAGKYAADAQALVEITASQAGDYGLTVSFDSDARSLRHRDCRALFEAAIVMIAMHVQPEGDSQAATGPEASTATTIAAQTAVVPTSPQIEKAPDDSASETTRRSRVMLRSAGWLELGVVHGIVPDFGLTLGAGARLGGPLLSLGGALHYAAPRMEREHELITVQALGARILLLLTPLEPLWLGVGVEGDLLLGRGQNIATVARDRVTRGAVRAELGVSVFRRGRHRLALSAGAALALHRARFLVTNFGVAYRPELWAFSGALQWQVQFGR